MSYPELIFPIDYIIIGITILFVIFSFIKGFINSILVLLTWIGSIFITIYTYNSLSIFISTQLLKVNIFNNYDQITNIIGIIISIPLIFLITLFILKKIRKILSSDLDKQFLGIIFDKFFGFVYGLVFSYFIFSTIIYSFQNIDYLNLLNQWSIDNSYILNKLDENNQKIIDSFFEINIEEN